MMGGLFPELTPVLPPPPPPEETTGERRRRRQAEAVASGQHPLSVALRSPIRLHPEAAPWEPRDAPGVRCGTCRFRRRVHGGNRSYPKCTFAPIERSRVAEDGRTYVWEEYPRATHGEGTDVAAAFPGCVDYDEGGVPLR